MMVPCEKKKKSQVRQKEDEQLWNRKHPDAGIAIENTASGFKLKRSIHGWLKQTHESYITHMWFLYLCRHFILSFSGWKWLFRLNDGKQHEDAFVVWHAWHVLIALKSISWILFSLRKALYLFPDLLNICPKFWVSIPWKHKKTKKMLKCHNILTHNRSLPPPVISYSV